MTTYHNDSYLLLFGKRQRKSYQISVKKSHQTLIKVFADDTPILCTLKSINISTDQVNGDLEKNSNWAHQWRMSFNPCPMKLAQEVVFFN